MKIGDKVKILNASYYTNYYPANIPIELIVHGHTPRIGDLGEIVAKHNEYWIVKYKSTGRTSSTTLGFTEDSLEVTYSIPTESNDYLIF